MLKCKRKPFHVWEDPVQVGKGKGCRLVDRGKLTLYNLGWCSVCLTGNGLQLIAGSVLCMCRRCAAIDPTVRSTPHSRHGILFMSLTRYESPTPVHFRVLASSNIPERSIPGCHVIVRDLATLAARPYFWKRPIRKFINFCR